MNWDDPDEIVGEIPEAARVSSNVIQYSAQYYSSESDAAFPPPNGRLTLDNKLRETSRGGLGRWLGVRVSKKTGVYRFVCLSPFDRKQSRVADALYIYIIFYARGTYTKHPRRKQDSFSEIIP